MEEVKQEGDYTCWYKDGNLHREDGPAFISIRNNHEEWYLNGVLHRIGGPALNKDGHHMWFVNGVKHREGGPSYHCDHSLAEDWYVNGKLHREDGPAVIYGANKRKLHREWHIDGVPYTEKEFEQFLLMKKLEENLVQKPRKKKIKP